MTDTAELVHLMMLNTIGMAVLQETLKAAQRAPSRITGSSEAEQCYVWVQGTGLDHLIDTFHLNLDAESLRVMFNYQYRSQPS